MSDQVEKRSSSRFINPCQKKISFVRPKNVIANAPLIIVNRKDSKEHWASTHVYTS